MKRTSSQHRKRGAIAAWTVVSCTTLIGFAALTIDTGYLYNAQAELQSVADAAALAGAIELMNEQRLQGETELNDMLTSVRQNASYVAALNRVTNESVYLDLNTGNGMDGDIVIGRLDNFLNMNESISLLTPEQFNTVGVRVRRDSISNGPVSLWFARLWGIGTANLVAQSAAGYEDNIVGFRATEETNAGLLPISFHKDFWDLVVAATPGGNADYTDAYSYDPETGAVTPGSDGIPEINIFPGNAGGQLPPGNYGTVDIGSGNNSTSDIERQILEGVSANDLSYMGGEFSLADGPVTLNGDTGISAGIKDELASVVGYPRTIPLFDTVSGPGNNSSFRIVSFAGIRVMKVHLTGAMDGKVLMVQPAFVADTTAVGAPGNNNTSAFVYTPIRLVR